MEEGWSNWLVGFLFGMALAVGFGVFGTFALLAGIGVLVAGALSSRSATLASGAFVGGGVTWAGLLLLNAGRCSSTVATLGRCEGPDLTPFAIQAAVAIGIGLALGGVSLWRSRAAGRSQT
jgi:hypothetical protein